MKGKIVLISPDFFNLSSLISEEIIKQGFDCIAFSDRPSNGFFSKALLRVNRNSQKWKIQHYFNYILKRCVEIKPQKIIVVFGQAFTGKMFLSLKRALPQTEFIYYTWDSVDAFPIIKDKFAIFDRAYSFDTDDCKKYSVDFLPLFYSYKSTNIDYFKYDYSFIGTIKKGKYQIVRSIVNQLNKKYKNGFVYMFLQSPFVYQYYKIKDKNFLESKMSEFKYKRLDAAYSNKIFEESKIIIDVVMSNQNGLTIRTFDALHLKKKLITNNSNICKYPFYSPDNILVFDGNDIDFESDFFKKPFNEAYSLDESYSLKHFVSVLLEG
jgi:hypothetical protein